MITVWLVFDVVFVLNVIFACLDWDAFFMVKNISCNRLVAGEGGGFGSEAKKDNRPFFKTFATLSIPNIVMTPGLDDVQQTVNKVLNFNPQHPKTKLV